MSGDGWIKMHRRFLKWEWYSSRDMKALFIHLLLVANHNGKTWRGITVSRGQVITTREALASETGVPARSIRTCLDNLVKTGEIIKESTKHYTLITILNYDKYQLRDEENTESEAANRTPSQSPTNGQQTANGTDCSTGNYDTSAPTNGQQTASQASIQTPQTINKEYIYINNYSQAWRYLTSVQRSLCGFDKDREAEMKRDIFRQEVECFAQEVGMNPQQINAFVRHWTEHNPGSDKIRAEGYDPFNTKERMLSWMERERPAPTGGQSRQQKQDKLQTLIDERNKFQQALYGSFNTIPADSSPDFQSQQ